MIVLRLSIHFAVLTEAYSRLIFCAFTLSSRPTGPRNLRFPLGFPYMLLSILRPPLLPYKHTLPYTHTHPEKAAGPRFMAQGPWARHHFWMCMCIFLYVCMLSFAMFGLRFVLGFHCCCSSLPDSILQTSSQPIKNRSGHLEAHLAICTTSIASHLVNIDV